MLEAVMDVPMPGVIETLWAEEALLDAGTDTGVDDAAGVDAGSDAGDGAAEAGDDTNLADSSGDGADSTAGDTGDDGEPLSGAKLWNQAKESLKDIDPKLRGAINKAIHQADSLRKAFPDGVEKATAVIQSIMQLANQGGDAPEKIVAETAAERAYFRELDAAYTEGKAEFAEKLATASPESFDKLAPMIFGKYAETNPDGFASYVSQTVLHHMESADVPLHFKVLATFLPQLADGPAKDRVIEAIEGIYGWQNQLRALAAKKPAAKEAKQGEGDGKDLATREQQLAEREQQVTLSSWNAESLQPGIRMVYAEADRIAGKQKLTAEERKDVLNLVGEELDIRLAGNKKYGEAMRGYLQAGNKQAFQQRLDAERKKLIPGATKRAVDDVIAKRAAKTTSVKKDGAQKAAPGVKQTPAAASGEKVEWIGGYPTAQGLVVDLNRTSHSMLTKKRAYIKGRDTPVAWK